MLDRWEPAGSRWGTALTRKWGGFWHNHRVGRPILEALYGLRFGWRRDRQGRIRPATSPYSGGTCWRWPWAPRTCSFCGSAHPGDVRQLLAEGWTVEHTGKGYKAYLRPPRDLFSPVPPVKIYSWHVSREDLGMEPASPKPPVGTPNERG